MARPVAVPQEATALGLLDRVDYQDAYAVEVGDRRSPREWAALAMEGAPPAAQSLIRWAQRPAFRLGRRDSPACVAGWEILDEGPHHLALGAAGALFTARVVLTDPPGRLELSTFLRYEKPVAGRVWAVLVHSHRRTAPYLLRAAAARSARG